MGCRLVGGLVYPIMVLIGLGACFFGSLLWAAAFFPHGYDWRYTVISSLASPRDNPHAYGIACAGLAVSGLLLIPFAFFLQKRLERFAPKLAAWAGKLFLLGAICLTLSALIVPGHYRILGIGRSHEHLAQISSVAFCLSLILYFGAILRLPPPLFLLRVLAGLVVMLPVTALIVSRASLFLAYEFSSSAVYHAVKVSLWSSLALWEWVGAFCIYLFLGFMTMEGTLGRRSALDQTAQSLPAGNTPH
jgi:hypothetical protein